MGMVQGMGLSAQLIPEDNAAGGEGLRQIDDALVAAAPELEGDVLFLPEKAAVHQNIDAAQEVVRYLAAGVGAIPQQLVLQPEAGEAPDILPGIAAADLPQEGQQVTLVPGLEGLATQHRQSADEGLVQLPEDLRFRLVGEGLAVAEVPCLGLKAVGAVVGAAGDEQRHPDSGSVGDITFFQGSIVHDMASFR